MRDSLGSAKEAWNKFCAGAAAALPQFHDNAVTLASKGGGLINDHLARLVASIAEAAQWLRKDPLKQNDTVAMEIATALLLADNALENYEQLGGLPATSGNRHRQTGYPDEGRNPHWNDGAPSR
ncbi:MAG: hypothetical protein M5R42_13140 [Rhodocyclaceae bacterium]|nr:hypothetical protein [Rhodocyclaceae bacterium]